MENGHDSPYLWVNWVMWLANTNGRKPLVFSLERSQQIIMCTLNSGAAEGEYGFGNPGTLRTIEKAITKTAAYRNVSKL